MKKTRINQKPRTAQRMRTKIIIAGFASATLLATCVWLVMMNLGDSKRSRAAGGDSNGGMQLNTGEILVSSDFNHDIITKSNIGPDATGYGNKAHLVSGGRSSTKCLSSGGKDIDLTFENTAMFDQDGVDVSIDYKGDEPTGNFFTRGSAFNFGFNKRFLCIMFKTQNNKGNAVVINATTDYEIPSDEAWRNFRFIYNPVNGRAEIFVNSVPVWSQKGSPNCPLFWKDGGSFVIGKNMDGNGQDVAVFDNLIIRATASLSAMSESLLNFMLEPAEGGIKIMWTTTAVDKVDQFAIERSINGIDFTKVAMIKAFPEASKIDSYMYQDITAVSTGIVYYRLKQILKDGKFISHPVTALRIKNEGQPLTIDKVSALNNQTLDVSYFIPENGKVWIQVTDEKGKILKSEAFDAHKGKNIYNFKDKDALQGAHKVNIIFNDKRVTAQVPKG